MISLFERSGYEKSGERLIFQLQLAGFRPPMDRYQMRIRRAFNVYAIDDPPSCNWWDACTFGLTDRTRYDLCPRDGSEPAGSLILWDMEPLASSWGVHAVGLSGMDLSAGQFESGEAAFLLGEALRRAQSQGVTLAEAHADASDQAAIDFFTKLGFVDVERGIRFSKRGASGPGGSDA